jgi:hypothetical protein
MTYLLPEVMVVWMAGGPEDETLDRISSVWTEVFVLVRLISEIRSRLFLSTSFTFHHAAS